MNLAPEEGAQVFGGGPSGGPSVSARLVRLGRVDPSQPIGHTIDLERIAIDHANGVGKGGRGGKRKCCGQSGQFHLSWLAPDYGDNAAATSTAAGRPQ